MSDTRVSPPLERLAGCVTDALAERKIKCGVMLTPGQGVSIDQAAGEDMAWVRLVDITVAQQGENGGGTPCAAEWTVSVEVGVALCWTVQEDPLTREQHLKHFVEVQDVMMALYKAIACCSWVPAAGRPDSKKRVTPVRWQPIGPQGGIVGGAWLLTFTV